MKFIALVAAGSMIGGVLRYLISQWVNLKMESVFPWATLVVNVLGCLLIGIVYGLFFNARLGEEGRLFLATGVLGGFTTFSSFSNETFTLLRDGNYSYALAYISCSVIIGVSATFGGYMLVKN